MEFHLGVMCRSFENGNLHDVDVCNFNETHLIIFNPRFFFVFYLSLKSVRAVNELLNKNGILNERKEVIITGMRLRTNGKLEVQQFSPHIIT